MSRKIQTAAPSVMVMLRDFDAALSDLVLPFVYKNGKWITWLSSYFQVGFIQTSELTTLASPRQLYGYICQSHFSIIIITDDFLNSFEEIFFFSAFCNIIKYLSQ